MAVVIRRGSTVPVTARPYFGSSSSTVWPPTMTAPASATFSAPPLQYRGQDPRPQRTGRKTDQVEGRQGLAAHGVDVREGVGRGDPAEGRRVVDHGGEEIDGLHQGGIFPQAIDPGVGKGDGGAKEGRILGFRQLTQHLRQWLGSQFGGSAAAAGQGGETDRFFGHGISSF